MWCGESASDATVAKCTNACLLVSDRFLALFISVVLISMVLIVYIAENKIKTWTKEKVVRLANLQMPSRIQLKAPMKCLTFFILR